jgi:hypothetical protein
MIDFNMIVAEGHWDNYSNDSVKKLFDLVSDLLKGNSHAYKYLNFADPTSFQSSMRALSDPAIYKYLYVGSHGNDTGVYGSDKTTPISRTILKNVITGYTGLYLGTCLFGTDDNMSWLVQNADLTWCAGYRKSVDWIDSSAFDMAFWKEFQSENIRNKQNNLALAEIDLLDQTIASLKSKYSSLILDLGFNVVVRRDNVIGLML